MTKLKLDIQIKKCITLSENATTLKAVDSVRILVHIITILVLIFLLFFLPAPIFLFS